jgi:hypothetical protein
VLALILIPGTILLLTLLTTDSRSAPSISACKFAMLVLVPGFAVRICLLDAHAINRQSLVASAGESGDRHLFIGDDTVHKTSVL